MEEESALEHLTRAREGNSRWEESARVNGPQECECDEEVAFVFLGLKLDTVGRGRSRSLLTEAVVQVPSAGHSACCLLKVH